MTDDDSEVAQQANEAIQAARRCVVREDGKKSHVFLNHGNKCQCGDVDLNTYREMELR